MKQNVILLSFIDCYILSIKGTEHTLPNPRHTVSEPQRALALLQKVKIAKLEDLRKHGITNATMSRLARRELVVRVAHGLYRLTDADVDTHYSLAEAASVAPRGVICLVSALSFHELTDTIPGKVWVAIPNRAWRPVVPGLPIKFVRFGDKVMNEGIERHDIDGVSVQVYNPAKTVVDLFRYWRHVGLDIAIEGLRNSLRTGKATPAEIEHFAKKAGKLKLIKPYLRANRPL